MKTKYVRGVAIALVLVVSGCATSQPLKGRADLLTFLVDGKTARQEVVLQLGQPSARFEHERILTYRLGYEPKNSGYYVLERNTSYEGWPTWKSANFSLVLIFDEAGVLDRHSLVRVN